MRVNIFPIDALFMIQMKNDVKLKIYCNIKIKIKYELVIVVNISQAIIYRCIIDSALLALQ